MLERTLRTLINGGARLIQRAELENTVNNSPKLFETKKQAIHHISGMMRLDSKTSSFMYDSETGLAVDADGRHVMGVRKVWDNAFVVFLMHRDRQPEIKLAAVGSDWIVSPFSFKASEIVSDFYATDASEWVWAFCYDRCHAINRGWGNRLHFVNCEPDWSAVESAENDGQECAFDLMGEAREAVDTRR